MKSLAEIANRKTAVFTFGRMNPPTIGHEKLINKVLSVAKSKNATPYIFVSHTQDVKKNPLTSKQKLKYLELGIPSAANSFVHDQKIRTIFDALVHLKNKNYSDVILVVGSDRVAEFEKTIRPYVNHPDPKKSLDLNSFSIVSAGERDPDDNGVSGISASKMREFVANNDFNSFVKGVPSKLSNRFAREMFQEIKKSMNIHELVEEIQKTKDSLNISRNKMPQIKKDFIQDFIKTLKKDGVSVHERDVAIKSLKPTQSEINVDKVKEKHEKFLQGKEIKPFIVSYDNHILDGHHQLYALKILDNDTKVKCHVVGLSIKDLLKYAHKFPKTTYKEIDE